MHRSTAHNYGSLTASPSVFEENESCGDACARQLPSLEWIKAYDFAWLWNDVAGGVTLGLVLLAQSLAHAHLCGVAPIRGVRNDELLAIQPRLLPARQHRRQ